MSITRRDFVGRAAAGVAAGVLATTPKLLLADSAMKPLRGRVVGFAKDTALR